MDAPLLALTRKRPGGASPASAAAENMRQLVQLRWIAVVGQLTTILFTHYALAAPLPMLPMLLIIGALISLNVVTLCTLPRRAIGNGAISFALLFDILSLGLQLYLSGGAGNPFISLFLVQIVLGAILLELWRAALLLVAAVCCYAVLSVVSVPLILPDTPTAEASQLYVIGNWLSFALVGALLLLFISRIRRNLRARDLYVADLRQHAAEEDGIVRMGLFASGAAHELGSPLGSLSVILNDWRRMPRIAADAELAEEVEEMEAEVQRCKSIVTDILHSAGQPRGDAIEGVDAVRFLRALASTWHATHSHIPLHEKLALTPGAIILGDAALRQAIWNGLDNAAEASPAGVELSTELDEGMLHITVEDGGPGFDPAELQRVGRLMRSRKGAGHGLGLFLAANVARRLGGRLNAANLDQGGARVTIAIPVIGQPAAST